MMMLIPATELDTAVIGGGFYGARLALMLRSFGQRVSVIERGATLIGRASLRNQARVHNGYHYPRSILTSLRSRMNYARFLDEYADCVDRSFPHYYAIGRGMSKITAGQFVAFCQRIDAPLEPAPAPVKRMFDAARIDSVFEVQECAFDAVRLRERLEGELRDAGVQVLLAAEAVRIRDARGRPGVLSVMVERGGKEIEINATTILNCTYSRINRLLVDSAATPIPMKHELTELALVEPPEELARAAVTVMDGPFFSLMPYPSRGLYTLSHVRYTPHSSWEDRAGEALVDGDAHRASRESRFLHMVRDAERYLPVMRQTRYADSLFEVKTLMPRSEQDDSRPILLRRTSEFPGCINVLGAKIDSVYDVEDALRTLMGDAARLSA
jgi:glycine/D-amino acid oxidase-like deaminating enzyme